MTPTRSVPLALALVVASISSAAAQAQSSDLAVVRKQLEARYEENRQAFFRKDIPAIMALRDTAFHTVTPDGQQHDRAWMEQYTVGLLNGIDKWIDVTFVIDTLSVEGDKARAIVRQHVDRMALRPDNKVHHVETWVTQREVWVRTPAGWKFFSVDSLRDQKRLVDGVPN